jgi:peroxiredoxin
VIDEVKTRLKRWARTATGGGRVWPELLLIAVVVIAVRWYQTRDLLPADAAAAPPFRLQTLSGEFVDLAALRGRPTLVYFFAPWCRICSASASNIQHLRTALPATDLNIVMIALSYETSGEVRAFARRHDLEIPVLLGTTATARDFQVPGFPTYYVIDSNGAIVSRDFGYTTYLGLRWRTFLAE